MQKILEILLLAGINFRPALGKDIPRKVIPSAGPRICPRIGENPPDGHFIAGESPGLIRTDYGCRAEPFGCRKPPNDGIALCHALHANCKRNCDYCRKTFGDCGNCKAYGNKEEA